MYFEPSKKIYYRFPSAHSMTDLDSKYYFPEKPAFAEENTRFENGITSHVPEREVFYDI